MLLWESNQRRGIVIGGSCCGTAVKRITSLITSVTHHSSFKQSFCPQPLFRLHKLRDFSCYRETAKKIKKKKIVTSSILETFPTVENLDTGVNKKLKERVSKRKKEKKAKRGKRKKFKTSIKVWNEQNKKKKRMQVWKIKSKKIRVKISTRKKEQKTERKWLKREKRKTANVKTRS